ncbi:MAG TPA: bifunctional pyr operon transcriptional regulator/uracil phosphoribosyltransferase PyrR [Lentisphaeria bacterium]|nr:MAG: hypothetical protein A2X47_09040 [Lentisphaerae bacterium GWF2_38_69]HBM16996.1 bifunctional pyr operon transcriptional regulator/uracil phosphoribosyltransferase PyrR [Lentisphaeria bacterium]
MEEKIENRLMDARAMELAIERLASKIIEHFPGKELKKMAFLGIQERGTWLSERLYKRVFAQSGNKPLIGTIDTSMYRDDIGLRKNLSRILETSIPFDVNDRNIVLIDDVLSSGRTIRAALDAITDYGRPKTIRLAVLVDRGSREFPIAADFIGMKYVVSEKEKVHVCFKEHDGEDIVYTKNRSEN